MKLSEITPVAEAALPLADFRAFLRLGTGFTDDGLQDGILVAALRAALASIEARAGKAVYRRDFLWITDGWRDPAEQGLPVAPVSAVQDLSLRDAGGQAEAYPLSAIALLEDAHRPRIRAHSGCLPAIPTGGQAELRLTAGYAADWADLPPDLRQAVLTLAGFFYENRLAEGGGAAWPAAVNGLLAPYLTVRLFGGVSQ
ncbi:hypothetical protein PSA7680_00814 [Pseudoruegeria aquimaris]|uniref:Phage gp6-like head-tail connector protein n=1 Tax=Pseudoruegeria aquimaris TaxID=393663 RepID=A0A1Y5RP20_9RHOB|nr:hypothetical protein [Pseudoruegeria aquimaris]SLN21677.1 hypothetical protein PSA7680_00814 [Pseudoruegeria aquimaris]